MDNEDKVVPPYKTGKVRAVQSHYDFKFYLEDEMSDGAWVANNNYPSFIDVKAALEYFARAKKIMQQPPAELGDINDAG